jgi:hypothetical protein
MQTRDRVYTRYQAPVTIEANEDPQHDIQSACYGDQSFPGKSVVEGVATVAVPKKIVRKNPFPRDHTESLKDRAEVLDECALPRAKINIAGVLNDCGRLAKLLHNRIESGALEGDARTCRDIQTHCAEVEFFLGTYGRSRKELNIGAPRAEQYELEGLSEDLPISRLYLRC